MLLLSMMMFRWWWSPWLAIANDNNWFPFFPWLAPANADDSAWGQHLDSIILSGAMCRWIVKINSYLTYLLECQVTLLLHIWHANGSHRQPRMLMATFSIWCLGIIQQRFWWLLPYIHYDSQHLIACSLMTQDMERSGSFRAELKLFCCWFWLVIFIKKILLFLILADIFLLFGRLDDFNNLTWINWVSFWWGDWNDWAALLRSKK